MESDLFISHRFSWMDMRDEIAWCNKHKNADEERCYVESQDIPSIKLYGYRTDIVGLCIEFDEAKHLLQG